MRILALVLLTAIGFNSHLPKANAGNPSDPLVCVIEKGHMTNTYDYRIVASRNGQPVYEQKINWTYARKQSDENVPACRNLITELKQHYLATNLCSIYWPSVVSALHADSLESCRTLADGEGTVSTQDNNEKSDERLTEVGSFR